MTIAKRVGWLVIGMVIGWIGSGSQISTDLT